MSIDQSLFSKDEKPGEFQARFKVRGEVIVTIRAENVDDARAKATAMMDDDEFGLELDDISDISLDHVSKTPAMYRITRDGRKMQANYLREGDLPRDPDDRGF